MRVKKKKRIRPFRIFLFFIILFIIINIIRNKSDDVGNIAKKQLYPLEYTGYVSLYSEEYEIDPMFILAVIKTESNFNPDATSEVGATGLMQIMEDAYEWVRDYRIHDDREHSYSDLYSPQLNIEYGSCMLSYLYNKYGNYELAAAAYHAGMTTVDNWLKDGTVKSGNTDFEDIPSDVTRHYVRKVMNAYDNYKSLYNKDDLN